MFSIRLSKLIHARNIEFNTSKLLQISYRNSLKKFNYCIFLLGVSIEKHEFLAASGQVFAQNLDWQERCIRLGWASCLTAQIQEDVFSEIDR